MSPYWVIFTGSVTSSLPPADSATIFFGASVGYIIAHALSPTPSGLRPGSSQTLAALFTP